MKPKIENTRQVVRWIHAAPMLDIMLLAQFHVLSCNVECVWLMILMAMLAAMLHVIPKLQHCCQTFTEILKM